MMGRQVVKLEYLYISIHMSVKNNQILIRTVIKNTDCLSDVERDCVVSNLAM